ncbi:MAG: hypothetical protein RBR54_04635 [Sulfurimonas sp.]|jgi:hypothetical protein|nr:hypothetical protein [Sulfurimonas sp.]
MYIKTLLALLGAFVLLLIYQQIYMLGCIISLAIPLLITLIITYSLARMKLEQRRCLAACYFREDSVLSKVVKSPIFLTLISFFLALFVALFLFTSLPLMDLWGVLILLADSFLLGFAYIYLLSKFHSTLKERMRERVVIAFITWINVAVMALFYAAMQYYTSPPIDLQNGLEQNMILFSNSVASECGFLNTLLKLNAEAQVLQWHTWSYLIDTLEQDSLRFATTLLFLLQGGLLFFALSRYILEVVRFVHAHESENG